MVEHAVQSFAGELRERLKELQEEAMRSAGSISDSQLKRRTLQSKATNLAEAIANLGYSPSLGSQLAQVEQEIRSIDEQIAARNQPLDLAFSLEEVREFVSLKMADLSAIVVGDPVSARNTLARHIQGLVLTPKESADGPVYEVSGDVDLFGGDEDVMQMVARDGLEPPTPAFSGPRSTN